MSDGEAIDASSDAVGDTPAEPAPRLEPDPVAAPLAAAPSTTEPPPAVEPTIPVAPAPPPAPAIPLVSTRGLLPAAFDLVTRSSEDMRRASFYIGAVTLGTVGPFALGLWAIEVADVALFSMPSFDTGEPDFGATSDLATPVMVLGIIAMLGFIVAAIESRTLATAVLGGRMASKPITLRHAVARARARFWTAVGATIVVGIVLAVVQGVVDAVVTPALGAATEATLITSTVVTATIGAPFAYVLCGVVLGDVGALESIRRSFMVARARWTAAALIVTFETIAAFLIFFGLSTGADLLLRAFGVLGIGTDSGPAGLALATVGVVAAVFAVGTLLYTVTALTVAPQVVMFVGLTHATGGLDHGKGVRTARFFSRPMLVGVLIAVIVLALLVTSL